MKPKIVTESLTSLQRNLNQNKLKAKKKKKIENILGDRI